MNIKDQLNDQFSYILINFFMAIYEINKCAYFD